MKLTNALILFPFFLAAVSCGRRKSDYPEAPQRVTRSPFERDEPEAPRRSELGNGTVELSTGRVLEGGLIRCLEVSGELSRCEVVSEKAELAPRQPQRSRFDVRYEFVCPGGRMGFGLRSDGEAKPLTVTRAEGAQVSLTGFGPIVLADLEPALTAASSVSLSCKLVVREVRVSPL